MNYSIPVLNLISALYVIVMLAGSLQVPAEAVKVTRTFRFCLVFTFIGLFAETGAYLLDGKADQVVLQYLCNTPVILLVDCIVTVYSLYLRGLLPDRSVEKYKKFTTLLVAFGVLSFIINTVTIAAGLMFKITDGRFVAGPFYGYRMILPAVIFACIFYLFISKYQTFGLKSRWLSFMFILIPGIATLASVIDGYEVRFGTYSITSVCLFVVYVVLQSKIVIETDVNARLLSHISVSDALTGLKNRRGYDDLIDSMPPGERVGVVFCDANGLKAVNDSEGHAAGDTVIKKIARMLLDAFPDGEVCRISGDEFVCVVRGVEEKEFAKRMDSFGKDVMAENRIIAFGHAQGAGGKFMQLVKEAEKMMYFDKNKYYLETGKDRRS
ncbi:MAG: GGDEF domain-containing protein [Lachnospiraceae bacterium]|nr:GGDEF domain-containing protein [Lachnospiraceae bacterium]